MLKKIKSGLLFLKYSNEIESDYEINLGNNHIWTWYKVQILEMLFSTKLMNVSFRYLLIVRLLKKNEEEDFQSLLKEN